MPALDTTGAIGLLREALLAGLNPDGGCPYYPRKSSRIEPTAWAALALGAHQDDRALEASARARGFLTGCQDETGLVVESPSWPRNLSFNGLAALALLADPQAASESGARRLSAALLGHRGVSVRQSEYFRQDNALQGWPWIDGTFSWVEPTAWCLLALKRWRTIEPAARSAERIAEAEKLLSDRCCRDGGWNYGNANVLGQDLAPHVPTSALGLLAMQDRQSEPSVARSLRFLQRNHSTEPSGMGLGLAAIGLAALGSDATPPLDALRLAVESLVALGNLHVVALALYAQTLADHHARAFTI